MSIISKVRVKIVEKDSLRAMASVMIAEAFYLTGLRVISGAKGIFVAFPAREITKGGVKEYADIYYPASKEIRDELSKIVLEAYYDKLDEGNGGNNEQE